MNLTKEDGNVKINYIYDAFGNVLSQIGEDGNQYQYSTKEYNATTGLVYFGARYYDPSIGRFITADPLGMADGPNLYIYCNNDPVNWVDPWGLCAGASGGNTSVLSSIGAWFMNFFKGALDAFWPVGPFSTTEFASEFAKTAPQVYDYNTAMYEQYQEWIDTGVWKGPNPYEDLPRRQR